MSTSYSACLVVGIPYDELGYNYEEIDDNSLDTFCSGDGTMLVGIGIFASPEYGYVDLPEKYKLEETISVTFAKFLSLTGKIGKLYLTVNVI